MNKVFFKLNDHLLYLDYMLEEYDYIPMLYVCKDDDEERFLVLCTDFEKESYLITRINLVDLNEMLLGKIDMRSAFLNQSMFWKIQCLGNGYLNDAVVEDDISEFPKEYLPKEGDKYVLYDEEHREYQKRIARELEETIEKIEVQTINKAFPGEIIEGNDASEIEFFDTIKDLTLVYETIQTTFTNNEIGLYAA